MINLSDLESTVPGRNTGQWYKYYCMFTDQPTTHFHFANKHGKLIMVELETEVSHPADLHCCRNSRPREKVLFKLCFDAFHDYQQADK